MKYAVFSTPRTASTLIHDMIRNHFNITGHGQLCGESPLDIRSNVTLRHQYINERIAQDNYVVKLFSINFTDDNYWFNRETFDWESFDKIIITTRTNVVDQVASLYYRNAYKPGNNSLFPVNDTPVTIDFTESRWINFLESLKHILVLFHSMKDTLVTTYPTKVCVLPSEIFYNAPEQYLPIVNSLTGINFTENDLTPSSTRFTGLDYSKKYTNYNELKAIVDSWGIPN